MSFEKKFYKLRGFKPLLSFLLLSFLSYHSVNAQCEEVDFTIQIDVVRGVCESGERAILELSVNDGMSEGDAFGYEWTDGINGGEIESGMVEIIPDVDANPNYCITVTRFEEDGCTHTECIEVPTITTLNCVLEVSNNVGCGGEATGELTATVSGGSGDYVYQWSSVTTNCSDGMVTDVSSETSGTISNLSPGKYLMTVTDNTGCSANRKVCEVEICTPPQVTVDLDSTQPDCDGDAANGNILAFGNGGTGDFSYAWTGPGDFVANTASLENLVAGKYNLILTDANGCTASNSVTLIEPDCIPEELPACDCEAEADGVNLFEVVVSTSSKKKGRGRNSGGATVKTAIHKVRFLGSAYDDVNNTTTFNYKISNCASPDISHYAFGGNGRNYLPCFKPANVIATEGPAPGWKKRDNAGISGLKFDQGLGGNCDSNDNSIEVSFTLSGNVETTTSGFYFGIKAGNGNNQVEVPGPDCDNIQARSAIEDISADKDNIQAEKLGQAKTINGNKTQQNINAGTTAATIAKVYPNPFVSDVNIVLESSNSTDATLEIINIAGKIIHTQQVNEGHSSQRIDLSNQPRGMYLIKVSGGNTLPQIHKIMKH